MCIFRPGSLRVVDNSSFALIESMMPLFVRGPSYGDFEYHAELVRAVEDLKLRLPSLVELRGDSGEVVVMYLEQQGLTSKGRV